MNRNRLCSCGSGKRYKHCHGAAVAAAEAPGRTSAAPGVAPPDPLTTLHLALARQQIGLLAEAEVLYEQARVALPGHFDAIHMLGVVKVQLGKFEEAGRLLAAGLPLAPDVAIGPLKHNLGLCLTGLARQRGVMETLAADPQALTPPAPFARGYAIPEPDPAGAPRISIIVVDATPGPRLQRTLDSVRAQNRTNLEVVAVIAPASGRSALQEALAGCGVPSRLIVAEAAVDLVGQVNLASAAGTGDYLCFLRAGDRWTPRWLQQMVGALHAYGAKWGYGGLRVVTDDGTIVRFGASPAVNALLRDQDALYAHRTASLGFLSFNPVAAGRNLIVHSDLWRQRGGLSAAATDPLLNWALRTARADEPVYVDEPGYLIPPDTVGLHLHNEFARIIAESNARSHANHGDSGWTGIPNPYLRHGLSVFWARQWREIRASRSAEMPAEVLLGCAALLGVTPLELPVAGNAGPLR